MKLVVDLPNYDGKSLDVIWENGAQLTLDINERDVVIFANKAGLISLAKQMLYMAANDLPVGSHVHYDDFFTQNTSGAELIIEKVL